MLHAYCIKQQNSYCVIKTVEDIREAFLKEIRPMGIRYFVTFVTS